MARVYPLISSFNGGEWDPLLWGRTDLARYSVSCRSLSNFLPLVQGPATKRPGTEFLGSSKDQAGRLLIPFEFSTEQAYVIEAGGAYFRFWKDGGPIVGEDDAPVEIATPYGAGQLAALTWVQSADVLFLFHAAQRPQTLSRASHTDWTLADYDFADGPWREPNTGNATIAASGIAGSVTLTASANLFRAGHVGALWRLEEPTGTLPYDTWTPGNGVDAGGKVKFAGRVYAADASGTTGTRSPVHDEGSISDGGVSWTYRHDGKGVVRITAFVSGTEVEAEVLRELPGTAATKRWREGAWSDFRGWPRCGAFHQDRLYLAGSRSQPCTVWASRPADYGNHAPDGPDGAVAADNALNLTLGDGQVNPILWMSSGAGGLALGTQGGIWPLRGSGNPEEPITPDNAGAAPQVKIGCGAPRPVRVDRQMLFVDRLRRRMAAFGFASDYQGYTLDDVNLVSGHLVRPRITALAWQADPWSVLWCVLDDGSLVGLTYLPAQEVIGWHRHPLGGGGKVRSLAVIPGPEQDELWLLVERSIGGPKRYVERLTPRYLPAGPTDKDGCFFVDCGGRLDSETPVTAIGGLDWLEGQTLRVWADGARHPDRVVTGGAILLQRAARAVRLGLGYAAELETLDIDAGADAGSALGRMKRVDNVAVLLNETLGGQVGRNGAFEPILTRAGGQPMDASPPLFSGIRALPPGGGWDQAATVAVRHDEPGPCTVVAIGPRLTVNER